MFYQRKKNAYEKRVIEVRPTHTNEKIGRPTCRDKIQHFMTTRPNLLFISLNLSNQGPARKKAKKMIVMGICIHYTYIQPHTIDTTTPAPTYVASPPFLSPAFLVQIMREPHPLSNQNPGCSMLGLTFYYERYYEGE